MIIFELRPFDDWLPVWIYQQADYKDLLEWMPKQPYTLSKDKVVKDRDQGGSARILLVNLKAGSIDEAKSRRINAALKTYDTMAAGFAALQAKIGHPDTIAGLDERHRGEYAEDSWTIIKSSLFDTVLEESRPPSEDGQPEKSTTTIEGPQTTNLSLSSNNQVTPRLS
jgi:hypothetical protein